MKITKAILGAVMLCATTVPAMAQELKPYVGAIVGWDNVRLSTAIGGVSKSGVVYGGVIGADYVMLDNYVIGIEGEATGSSTSQSFQLSSTATGKLKAGRDLYVGGRLGAVVVPHTLAYFKAGYANSRATGSYTDSSGTISISDNLGGWRLGAGAEVALRKVRVRAEYRYSNYGEFKYQGIATGVTPRRHQVVLGAILDL